MKNLAKLEKLIEKLENTYASLIVLDIETDTVKSVLLQGDDYTKAEKEITRIRKRIEDVIKELRADYGQI